jgi:hypothetical protein
VPSDRGAQVFIQSTRHDQINASKIPLSSVWRFAYRGDHDAAPGAMTKAA